jgi:alkaline phosphatase D
MKKFSLLSSLFIFALLIASCQSKQGLVANPYEGSTQAKERDFLGLVPRGLDLYQAPNKIAFGSCVDQNLDQPVRDKILEQKPDLMIMMGDNVYATKESDKNLIDQYKKLAKVPNYKKARETIPFMATWDDHDYGLNDGGADFIGKEESRKAFWFHWPYVKDSTLLNQPGIFYSKVMGGTKEGRGRRAQVTPSVHVIMLDTRWNRSPLKIASVETITDQKQDPSNPPPVRKSYMPEEDPKATILGDEQWDWLEDQLRETADLKILVSSIQVIADMDQKEKWGNFPKEKQKLYDLIARTKPKNLVILSGDRHFASLAKTEIRGWGTLWDVTSSSLNKPKDVQTQDTTFVNGIYNKENFGTMTLDWTRRMALIELKDGQGNTVQQVELKLKK